MWYRLSQTESGRDPNNFLIIKIPASVADSGSVPN